MLLETKFKASIGLLKVKSIRSGTIVREFARIWFFIENWFRKKDWTEKNFFEKNLYFKISEADLFVPKNFVLFFKMQFSSRIVSNSSSLKQKFNSDIIYLFKPFCHLIKNCDPIMAKRWEKLWPISDKILLLSCFDQNICLMFRYFYFFLFRSLKFCSNVLICINKITWKNFQSALHQKSVIF